MQVILLSGGSGKRLWPLSNDARSKQFLRVLENSRNEKESMVQRVWGQLESAGLADSAIVATSKSQVEMIHSQLGGRASLIIEPCRRDTFPAIALAAAYLYTVKGVTSDEIVSVLPVDPFVETPFFNRVKDLEHAIHASNTDLALIGVKPTYPSTKYGYIIPEGSTESKDFVRVNHFTEKPSEEFAKALMDEGALWNCGVFGFKLGYLLSIMEEKGLSTDYHQLVTDYGSLPKISFDYEVVEKTEKIVMLPYRGYWKDLGTWNTLTEEMAREQIGKGIISPDSRNTHLINELDIPVTVLGVSDAIVVVSPDGILVSNKEASPRIKELVGDFDNRPMYEERLWCCYRVLDHTKFENDREVLIKRIEIKAGRNLSYQYHSMRSEIWTIVRGEGTFVLNGEPKDIHPGDVVKIDQYDHHAIKAISDLELIEVQTGKELIEEDIVRIDFDWNKISGGLTPSGLTH